MVEDFIKEKIIESVSIKQLDNAHEWIVYIKELEVINKLVSLEGYNGKHFYIKSVDLYQFNMDNDQNEEEEEENDEKSLSDNHSQDEGEEGYSNEPSNVDDEYNDEKLYENNDDLKNGDEDTQKDDNQEK